jgi:hypothetical protein|tara:strand:- start:45 stop:404 length:360 start_codon:yes stop_codon:yes gene_type:complete
MIKVTDSDIEGVGVIATQDIAKDSVIEDCFYIVIDNHDIKKNSRLNDYLFQSPDHDKDYYCVLGAGMIYNHGSDPNAEWQISEKDNRFLSFIALRDIKAGEEIVHDYGEDYWEDRNETR